MTVFNAFLKVLNKNKFVIILYTVILIIFGGLSLQTNDNSTNFIATKPDILIINNDKEVGITKSLIDYIKGKSNIINIKNEEDAINDALFYRDVNYIIYIPNNFRKDFLNKKNPEIQIKSTGDYQASLASMLLERYIKLANIYNASIDNEQEIIKNINNTLQKSIEVEVTSKLDTDNLSKASSFYNFANYSILAGCVYVICLILSSFKEKNISRRTIISSMNYKKYNKILLLSNLLFALILWIFYCILSFILLGNIMFTPHGLVLIINSFIFSICAVSIAFLIGNLVTNKEGINGIVNVVGLGSSFLCGAFVPMEFLPEAVLKIAHILPSYWYIKTNEIVKTIETFNIDTMMPIIINMLIILLFTFIFIIVINLVSSKKRKID